MEVTAQVTFLEIDRPPHGFRYFGDSCWPRIRYLPDMDTSCRMIFDDGVEAFDGDTLEIKLRFLDDSVHQQYMKVGLKFELVVANIHIANGEVKCVA